MVQVQQRILTLLLAALIAVPETAGRRFYDDDPILQEPRPLPVAKPTNRKINEYYDFFLNTFSEPGVDKESDPPPAGAVNTLGEVPDSAWYTNRHGRTRMSMEDLLRGPGLDNKPSMDAQWTVLSAKNEGITPGLLIQDARRRRYLLKFDPLSNPEMASAADVIGSKFYYALGYNVPENYIVYFQRNQLQIGAKTKITGSDGKDRPMRPQDVDDILDKVPRTREGQYRALASLFLPGEVIGPFKYWSVRRDDPNDIVPHQNRRDLRGLYVFASWLNHTDSKSLNTLDTVIEEDGVRFIRHHLIDFGAILGSDSFEAKSPRAGNVYLYELKPAAWQFLSLGLYAPRWMRVRYPDIPEAGRFQSQAFEPDRWRSNYPNPAFDSRRPDDCFWAARQVMAFTDDEIRALVNTGEFTNPRAAEWISRSLIERRNKIGRHYFSEVLPLDNFRVEDGRLEFEDLAVKYGFAQKRPYQIAWSRFDNEGEQKSPLAGESSFTVPRETAAGGSYFAADITREGTGQAVTVYLRKRGGSMQVVGIDRRW